MGIIQPGNTGWLGRLPENNLVSTRQRLMDNLSLTAKLQYRQFCQTHPDIIQEILQKLIAIHIGVTPEFLSKIRGEGTLPCKI